MTRPIRHEAVFKVCTTPHLCNVKVLMVRILNIPVLSLSPASCSLWEEVKREWSRGVRLAPEAEQHSLCVCVSTRGRGCVNPSFLDTQSVSSWLWAL